MLQNEMKCIEFDKYFSFATLFRLFLKMKQMLKFMFIKYLESHVQTYGKNMANAFVEITFDTFVF